MRATKKNKAGEEGSPRRSGSHRSVKRQDFKEGAGHLEEQSSGSHINGHLQETLGNSAMAHPFNGTLWIP